MLPALAFFGITLGEPVASVEKRLGAPQALSMPDVYAWTNRRRDIIRVLAFGKRVALVDVWAPSFDRRNIDLPEHGSLQLNESSHVNAEMEEPNRPLFMGSARMPFAQLQTSLLCVQRSQGTLLAMYFSGTADGGVQEIVFGTRDALRRYGVGCGPA